MDQFVTPPLFALGLALLILMPAIVLFYRRRRKKQQKYIAQLHSVIMLLDDALAVIPPSLLPNEIHYHLLHSRISHLNQLMEVTLDQKTTETKLRSANHDFQTFRETGYFSTNHVPVTTIEEANTVRKHLMDLVQWITKKRDGHELTEEQARLFFDGLLDAYVTVATQLLAKWSDEAALAGNPQLSIYYLKKIKEEYATFNFSKQYDDAISQITLALQQLSETLAHIDITKFDSIDQNTEKNHSTREPEIFISQENDWKKYDF